MPAHTGVNDQAMLQYNFDPFPILTTGRLILRQKHVDDAPEMFFLRSDEEVMKYIDRPRAKTEQDAVNFINMLNSFIANNTDITWAITLKDDPKLIGSIGYWRSKPEDHRSEVGYVLHPDHQGKGIMTEALHAVLDYGFRVMKLHSVEANINPDNKASAGLLEKAGFVQEAFFKENYYFNGKFLDTIIYSKLTPLR